MIHDLFVVARRDEDLYAYLKRHFAARADVEVILDRRRGERRRDQHAAPSERRRQQRRSRPAADRDLASLGVAVIALRSG